MSAESLFSPAINGKSSIKFHHLVGREASWDSELSFDVWDALAWPVADPNREEVSAKTVALRINSSVIRLYRRKISIII